MQKNQRPLANPLRLPLLYPNQDYITTSEQPSSKRQRNSSSTSNVIKRGIPTDHWRAVVDNFIIEFLAALFINVSAVKYGGMKNNKDDPHFEDPWTQLIAAVVMGLVMMTLKDDDFFFPDTTHTITLLMWAVGAYDNWVHPFARLIGQTVAMGVAIWLCKDIPIPQWVSLGRLPTVIFAHEMLGTIIEHMAVVYLFLPLLPTMIHLQIQQTIRPGLHVQSKNHPETEEPTNSLIMHGSIAFAILHWCLRLSFLSEMNPGVSLIKTVLWVWQVQKNADNPVKDLHQNQTEHHSAEYVIDELWTECLMQVWGQCVGFLLALVYIMHYFPLRKSVLKQHNDNSV